MIFQLCKPEFYTILFFFSFCWKGTRFLRKKKLVVHSQAILVFDAILIRLLSLLCLRPLWNMSSELTCKFYVGECSLNKCSLGQSTAFTSRMKINLPEEFLYCLICLMCPNTWISLHKSLFRNFFSIIYSKRLLLNSSNCWKRLFKYKTPKLNCHFAHWYLKWQMKGLWMTYFHGTE